jgi:hypothetical protein
MSMRSTRWTVGVALALGAVLLSGCKLNDDDDDSASTSSLVPANQARAADAKPITFGTPLELGGVKVTIQTPERLPPDEQHYMAPTWKFHVRVDNVTKLEQGRPAFVVRCDNVPDRGVEWKGESIDQDPLPKGSFVEGDQVVSSPINFQTAKAEDCTNPTLFLEYTGTDAPSAAAKLP